MRQRELSQCNGLISVLAVVIFCFAKTAYALEVKGISVDTSYKMEAPPGCGEIKSWHGDYTDLDGSTRREMHRGIDIVAPKGTPVIAAAPGRVVYRANQHAGGNALMIYHGADIHGNHVISYYAHLLEFKVERDAVVKRGDVIGLLGDTGNNMPQSRTPHLHFEVLIYPDGEMRYWFTGFLRGFRTVSPNYFVYPINGEQNPSLRSLPTYSSISENIEEAQFNGLTFPVACFGIN